MLNNILNLTELKKEPFIGEALQGLKVTLTLKYNQVIDYGNGVRITRLEGVKAIDVLEVVRSYRRFHAASFWIKDNVGTTIGEYDYDLDVMRIFGITVA